MSYTENMLKNITVEQLQRLRESEDHVEFKAARHNYPFAGGNHKDIRDRRKCVLGYVVALANKAVPSYYGTDAYQVKLTLTSEIENPALHIYALEEQARRDADHQLNAFQLFALYSISKGEKPKVDEKILQQMESEGLIKIRKKSDKVKYEMNADYLLIISRISEYESKSGEQVSEQVKMLVLALRKESSSAVLMSEFRLNSRQYFMRKYLNPAIEAGFVELTQPESPKSPKQKYRLSKKGIELQKLLYGEEVR